jgi:hypothetical protein
VIGPARRDEFRPLGRTAMHQHHVGVFGEHLVEFVPDQAMIVEVQAAS